MLDREFHHRFVVNKSGTRLFLAFCVELTNAEPETWKHLFAAAITKGAFKTHFADGGFDFYEKQIPALIENVRQLATCVSNEKSFSLEKSGVAGVIINNAAVSMGITRDRKIMYSRNISEFVSTLPEHRELIAEVGCNELVDVFFDVLSRALYQPKKNSLAMIPIRECPECKQPFLARRWDQRFCNQQHSQKWRSREYYRKRKEQEE